MKSHAFRISKLLLAFSILLMNATLHAHSIPLFELEKTSTDQEESRFISETRQLTFSGLRSGEGYFSSDGKKMIFQSEREKGNPFYQIFLSDLETGETHRVSPGLGMTTCAWIHPSKETVLFASTHLDPNAEKKMKDEIARRESGEPRPYAWDFDEEFDIFTTDFNGQNIKNLTNTRGYDAEGDWSPDGKHIVFASNRMGFSNTLSAEDQEIFGKDPSYMMDIFIMNADGSGVRQLTSELGYDGGPFFSDDGKKITYRHFAPDGRSAEIYTMDVDGGNKKQLTSLGSMSWAPYFHPSGDYLIFTTSVHGHHNFELYVVDAEGKKSPVRITYTGGFDGLPVFLPNGREISWTTTRGAGSGGQIFIAKWNDAEVRKLLDLPSLEPAIEDFEPEITESDLEKHVEFLASPTLMGRMTGQKGERMATQYVANFFKSIGLSEAGDKGYFQDFSFTAGVSLGKENNIYEARGLNSEPIALTLNKDWRPVSFSKNGTFNIEDIVFAGYGVVAPKSGEFAAYNSYEGLNVQDKWVLVFRYVPENIDKEYRRYLTRNATLRRKAMIARDLGAKGILVVSGPLSQVNDELVRLEFDASMQGAGVFALTVSDAIVESWLAGTTSLRDFQTSLDDGKIKSLEFKKSISGTVEIAHDSQVGRNTLARLQVGDQPSDETIVIGAHIDHLGAKINENTNELDVFAGADDNGSGSAAVLEIAQKFAFLKKEGALNLKKDIVFALWSGEELGLLGSDYFMKDFEHSYGRPYPRIAAYLNMDMVGRFEDKLVFQATGSSPYWTKVIEKLNMRYRLPLTTQEDPYLPTDSTSFYLRGVPTLNAFTGAHDDYHKPTDTPEKINYSGLQTIASYMFDIAKGASENEVAPEYVKVAEANQVSTGFRVFLGTIPDYTNTSVVGVLLNGVKPASPAELSGLKNGDIIVRLDGTKISNIYDYTYVLSALRVNEEVEIEVLRNGQNLSLKITPASRT